MNRPSNRLIRSVAVAAAGVAVGLAGTYTVVGGGAEGPRTSRPVAQTEVADWAREHRRSGLSPASLGANTTPAAPASCSHLADTLSQLADFARQRELTGLSPASLQHIDD